MFEDLIPELQPFARDLLQVAGRAGLLPRVTSTRRTQANQARLYRRWQSGLSPFPVAPPGLSAHEYGYAFDMVVTPMEALSDVGALWSDWGGVWGGRRDPVHFEYPGFVPHVDENIVQRAARSFQEIPWWASLWFPFSLATRPLTPEEIAANEKVFGRR